jgi:protein-S-isoprenylcysteine O-methyltransferase Ste14
VQQIDPIPQRLARWPLFCALLTLLALGIAGRRDLPMLNAFVAMCAVIALFATLRIDAGLARERRRRGQTGEDPLRLTLIRLLFAALFVVALLDIGRFHWSDSVPRELQLPALALAAAALTWILWAVSVNRFFIPVIRVQPERDHHVVSAGPYGQVRHPGYAGLALAAPASALALGSWWALLPAVALTSLFVARTAHEDRYLLAHLEGYASYTARVPWRLLPGIW